MRLDNVYQVWNWLREPVPRYAAARAVFLRAVAVTSFTAFLSLLIQIPGLIGVNGVLPAEQFFTVAGQQLNGVAAVLQLPSLAWVSASTTALQLFAVLGMIAAAALFFDVAPRVMVFVQWVLYLSLVVAGQVFLSFQWDILLLEILFFTVFLAPGNMKPGGKRAAPTRLPLYMLWFVLFKLMFLSGVAKLGGGDPVWLDGTALSFHYVTQPLPTPIAWFMDTLPVWLHQLSVILMFAVEILVPALIWVTDRFRRYAAAGIAGFNLVIMATGNYAFFNVLAIALCILLIPGKWVNTVLEKMRDVIPWFRNTVETRVLPQWLTGILVGFVLVQVVVVAGMFTPGGLPTPLDTVRDTAASFRTVNTYGLFVDMTTNRPELVVQGSMDGATWKPYVFKYKPGDPERMPPVVAPHQPRLDWQMWFAALRDRPPHWFNAFAVRLLQNQDAVTALLEQNPFPDQGPRFVRAVRYEYRFSNWTALRKKGQWWEREKTGLYMEPVALQDVQQAP